MHHDMFCLFVRGIVDPAKRSDPLLSIIFKPVLQTSLKFSSGFHLTFNKMTDKMLLHKE